MGIDSLFVQSLQTDDALLGPVGRMPTCNGTG